MQQLRDTPLLLLNLSQKVKYVKISAAISYTGFASWRQSAALPMGLKCHIGLWKASHNMIEYIHHDMASAIALNQCGCPQPTVSHRWHLSTIAYEDHIHHHVDPRCVSVHHHLCRQKTNVSFIVIQTLIHKHYTLRRLWLSSMKSQKKHINQKQKHN